MSSSSIGSDLERRRIIFTIDQLEPLTDEFTPTAYIWCGLDGGGTDRMVPILFETSDELDGTIPDFDGFSGSFDGAESLRPMVYSDGPEPYSDIIIDMTYLIKPIRIGEIGTEITNSDDVFEAALEWKDEFAERSLRWKRRPASHGGYNFRLSFRIYSTRFGTHLPIFDSAPSPTELQSALSDLNIPCAAIVPDKVSTSPKKLVFETRIEPGFVQL